MDTKQDIITIGESLIELSTYENITQATSLEKYYGGDTLVSAIAALRAGSKTGFISCIGKDCFSEYLIDSWKKEGLDTSMVRQTEGNNGLYILAKGQNLSEKEISLYRKKTAAANLCADDISVEYIQNSSVVYSSGRTQSLSISAKDAVKKAFKTAKDNNILTAYDPNFSTLIWSEEEARDAFDEVCDLIDIIFVNTKYDSKVVIDSVSINNAVKYLWDKGINTVIIKSIEDKSYYVGDRGKIELVKYFDTSVTDTTGAEDTFNGCFLHGIVSGMTAYKSAVLGSVAAGLQVQKLGAVKSIPYKEDIYPIFKGLYE